MAILHIRQLSLAVVTLTLAYGVPLSAEEQAPQPADGQTAVALALPPTAAADDKRLFVGAEGCFMCHKAYEGWRTSLHATGLKLAPDDRYSMQIKNGVIVDYDKNGVEDFKQGLDFNQISSDWDPYKPNAPILGYSGGTGYTIQIGPVIYPVAFVHGGSGRYKQRFVLRIPVTDRPNGLSAGHYYSPIQYNEANQKYVIYEPKYWYNDDKTVKILGPIQAKEAAKGKSFEKECSGCHATSMRVEQDENGEYISYSSNLVYVWPEDFHYLDLRDTGVLEGFNGGCERCHGPGNLHIVGLGQTGHIVNPAKLTAMQANELCGSCHSRGKSLPTAKHDFPYDELTGEDYSRYIGESLYGRFFQDKPGLWPDGKTSKQHHQQFQEFRQSSKWEFAPHKVTCMECHDVHNQERVHLRTQLTVAGTGGAQLTIAVKMEDNSLCLACHAGFGPFESLKREYIQDMEAYLQFIARVVSDHTHHSYDPTGQTASSRCTECHMARMAASGAPYDISSHTFKAVPPERTIKYQEQGGMPNSCAVRCHRTSGPAWGLPADQSLTKWNEESDVAVAQKLMSYYGPDGTWWKTKE